MVKKLDMRFIRYLNLFEKVTKVRTSHCFLYNSHVIFVVPSQLVSRAIGQDGKNVKRLSEILTKRIKIVAYPNGIQDIENFVSVIVHPVKFKEIEVTKNENGTEVIINAGRQSKAVLIGRNKTRLEELKNILLGYFSVKVVKIV